MVLDARVPQSVCKLCCNYITAFYVHRCPWIVKTSRPKASNSISLLCITIKPLQVYTTFLKAFQRLICLLLRHVKSVAVTCLIFSDCTTAGIPVAAKSAGCHPRCACSHSDVWGVQVGERRGLSRFGLMTAECAAWQEFYLRAVLFSQC